MSEDERAAIRKSIMDTVAAAPDFDDGVNLVYDPATDVVTVTLPAWQQCIDMTFIVKQKASE